MDTAPLVSIVTPFYNTCQYLAECVESVLRQTYQEWEYVLVDNCSTDGSSEIAAHYASRFPGKIRLVRTDSFLSQVQNYNFALSCITPASRYCKMVQADDWLFPDCVRNMVEVAETHPTVGIVAAYELEGERVSLDGLPYPSAEVPGRHIGRLFFLADTYLFGTPTSLLMRADVVRSRNPFFDERYAPFEDAHVCFEILQSWNFGFVHQVLTYSRRDNDSVLARIRPFRFLLFSRLAAIVLHGRQYLSEDEYRRCLKAAEREYFLFLGTAALAGRSRQFWEFHRHSLATIDYSLDWKLLGRWIPRAILECLGNPKRTWQDFWGRRSRASVPVPTDPRRQPFAACDASVSTKK